MVDLKDNKVRQETGKKGAEIVEKSPDLPLMPWNVRGPWDYMRRFAEEMDSLFEDFGMPMPRTRRPGLLTRWLAQEPQVKADADWMPRIEMTEREGQLVTRAELPGMSKENVKVEVTDEAITIQGERKDEKKETRKGYHYSECSYGSFFRSVPLPEGIDPSQAAATFRDGVLEVTMPVNRKSEKITRQIEIKGG